MEHRTVELYQQIARLPELGAGDVKTGKAIPSNGIEIFYEQGETVTVGATTVPRIVRVGAHREDARLLPRLGNHYYGHTTNSVFRRHVDSALEHREGAHAEPEKRVSEYFATATANLPVGP